MTSHRLCRWLCCLALLFLIINPLRALAQEEWGEVKIGGRSLVVVQGGTRDTTAAERARLIEGKVERLLRDPRTDPAAIQARPIAEGVIGIFHRDLLVMRVTPADAAAARVSQEELAATWVQKLRGTLRQLQPLYASERRVSVRTLSEHHVLLLLLQVATLLLVARACGEIAARLGQPGVIGYLAAGVILGQSVLGAFLPDVRAMVFPVEATQSYLLEVVSLIGVLFLLLLTGLETDVDLIRRQGKPAFFVAVFGFLLPFLAGWLLAVMLPARFLTTPESRPAFALFVATLFAVASVPVIAGILGEMGLLRMPVGQIILAGSLAHDTAAWVCLAVVARLVDQGPFDVTGVGVSLLGTLAVVVLGVTYGRLKTPALIDWVAKRSTSQHVVLTLTVVLMLLGAALTQLIGVHPTLGALLMGILVREHPAIERSVREPLETVTRAVFAPIFFAAAGLHVRVGSLLGVETLGLAALVLLVATFSKMFGGYLGARCGGMERRTSLAVAIGTNARGAMGIIIAVLGFSLGLLTPEMFTILILMAVFTTALAPPLLRRFAQPQRAGSG